MHYDHCGNSDLFPRARYHLQDREMEYCTGRCMCHAQLRNSYEEDYVVAMVRKLFAGRVTLPRRRRRDRARRHRPSHRRPRQGPAMRSREDAHRGRWCWRPTRRISTRTSTRAGCFRPPTISPRCWRATTRCKRLAGVARPRRARPRSAGAEALSGGQARTGGLGGAPRCRQRKEWVRFGSLLLCHPNPLTLSSRPKSNMPSPLRGALAAPDCGLVSPQCFSRTSTHAASRANNPRARRPWRTSSSPTRRKTRAA